MNLIITVKQKDCMCERIYKTTSFRKIPTIKQLKEIGADINELRKDKVTFDTVSNELYDAIIATWIRPYIKLKSLPPYQFK